MTAMAAFHRPSAVKKIRLKIGASLIAAACVVVTLASGQTPSDSVRITFRAHQPSTPLIYIPGQFNNWGNNSGGNIPPSDPSLMTYNGGLQCWTKTYTFRIHDPSDTRRTLGDSVFQYKFNRGGTSTGWFSDPLNPETNANENNNSVVRLTDLFWFQYYASTGATSIVRITIGLAHANNDSITAVRIATAADRSLPLTTSTITAQYSEATRILDYTPSPSIPKTSYIRLVAVTDKGDSVVYERGGYPVVLRPMPGYVQHGVTLPSPASGDSVSFRLRVGGKDNVFVRVAPLGEDPALAAPIPLYKSPGGDNWWVNVALAPGVTYEYLYELNEGGTKIFDPWGRWNGDHGSRFSLGPEGLTADNYAWTSAAYTRPPLSRLVVYELNLSEFAGGYYGLPAGTATFRDMSRMMWHFDSLGVNAIELMPVTDHGRLGKSGFSWGYDVNSYFALEPGYGNPADLKALVDSAHSHGIAVILDVVYNHMNDTGPLWQMDPVESTNPYFKLCTDLRPNEDNYCLFRDMDHFTNETQELIATVLKMFVDQYRIDGFRYDYTQGIGWTTADSTKGVLGWTKRIERDYGGSVYQILEHLPESPALVYYSGATSGWHDSFRDKVFDEARFRNVPLTDMRNLVLDLGAFGSNDVPATPSRYGDRIEPVNATVTHDEQSLIYEMTTFQGVPLADALVRDRLYATLMFTSLGIPMLWQGMEHAESRGWRNDNEKLSYRPVQWSLASTQRGQTQFAYYSALAKHRRINPALYRGVLRHLALYTTQKTLVWGFEDTLGTTKLMAVMNFLPTPQTIRAVPWLATGTWYSVFDQSTMAVSGTTIDSLVLPAYTAIVYSNIPDSVLLAVKGSTADQPVAFSLEQNFPNPFNPATTIRYSVPADGQVMLAVYDVLGREVRRLVDRWQPQGSFDVVWDGRSDAGRRTASGLYFYRLILVQDSGERSIVTRKMILVN